MGANGQIGGKNRSSTFGGHVRQFQGLNGAENTVTERSEAEKFHFHGHHVPSD
jgi:hypothetical protein